MMILISLTFSSCAAQKKANQKIDKEVQAVVIDRDKTPSDVARDYILNSDRLSDSTKTRLLELQRNTKSKSDELTDKIEKTKIILIETVLEQKMSNREFGILKKKIAKLEKERMENGFEALNQARKIISPKGNVEELKFYRPYLHEHLQLL